MGQKSSNITIAKNTFYLYIRMLLIMVVSMYTVRVVLTTLGVEDYGVYGAIGGVIASLSFVTSVLANASQRFFAVGIGKNDSEKLTNTFSMMFWLYLLAGIIAVCLFETCGIWFISNKMTIPDGRFDAAMWVFHFMILSFLVSLLNAPFQALIIAHEHMTIYAYVGIIDVAIKLGIVFFLQWLSFDKLKLYSILLFLSSLFTTSLYIIYCLKHFRETRIKFIWESSLFRDVFSFSSWTLFGSVSYICNTQGINLLLNVFVGPVANTAYSIGNQVKTLVNQFSGNFYLAVRPRLMKAYSGKERQYVNELFFYSSKFLFILLFVIIFPVYNAIDFLLELWLGSVGDYMSDFVRLMLVYALVLSMSDPITTIVQAANKVKSYYLIVDTFTLLALPLTYVAYLLSLPPVIAFYISIIIFIIAHFIRLRIFRPISGITLKEYLDIILIPIINVVVVSSLISCIMSYGLSNLIGSNFICEFIFMASNLIIALATSFYLVLNKSERSRVVKFVKSKISIK